MVYINSLDISFKLPFTFLNKNTLNDVKFMSKILLVNLDFIIHLVVIFQNQLAAPCQYLKTSVVDSFVCPVGKK